MWSPLYPRLLPLTNYRPLWTWPAEPSFSPIRVNITTDAIQSRKGYSRGVHLFKFYWDREKRGSHSCVGVIARDNYGTNFNFQQEG